MRVLAIVCSVVFAGCVGDIVPITPEPGVGQPGVDMAGGGGGGGGGDMAQAQVPQNVTFSVVQSDVDGKQCTGACHGTSSVLTTNFKIVPNATAAADLQANYTIVSGFAKAGDASTLLTKGLIGSGHTGGTYFAGADATAQKSDPLYVKWKAWIDAGAPSGL